MLFHSTAVTGKLQLSKTTWNPHHCFSCALNLMQIVKIRQNKEKKNKGVEQREKKENKK
jgi:ribosomal protein S26